MAFIEQLRPPVAGMDRIVNLVGRVGPYPDCPNIADDVKALQRLFGLLAAIRGISPPAPSGIYDAATGFFIYYAQVESKKNGPGTVVDGIVSPARPSGNYGSSYWLIVKLNLWVRQENQRGWEALLASFPEPSGRVDISVDRRR